MQALKNISVIITLASLSLSGSAAWAAGSFAAKANLDSFKLVPPLLTSRSGDLTLTFFKPTPTTAKTIALVVQRNPWRTRTRAPGDQVFGVQNIRLYFGQRFANGQPIATLCDDAIDTLKCTPTEENEDGTRRTFENEFELRDIQFQEQQIGTAGNELIDSDRRLRNDESGFMVIKDLIKRGLIYVVINSAFKAELGPDSDQDPETDEFIYTRDLVRITDGDLRGTLR